MDFKVTVKVKLSKAAVISKTTDVMCYCSTTLAFVFETHKFTYKL